MAVFNGERYLEQQLYSILAQLEKEDEILIVDDCSRDQSVELIRRIADPRVILLQNSSNSGPIASFETAIASARGKYIFLCDQDDIWRSDKVAATREIFESTDAILIVSDARIVDQKGDVLLESFFSTRNSGPGFWKNIYKNRFIGCCMAFKAEARDVFMPFPGGIFMHDQWIGLCASLAGEVRFFDEKLIDYRRHDKNVTSLKKGEFKSQLEKRLIFLSRVLVRLPRILSWRLARY